MGALQDKIPRNPSPFLMEICLLPVTQSDLSTEKRLDRQVSYQRKKKKKQTKISESPNFGVPFLWCDLRHSGRHPALISASLGKVDIRKQGRSLLGPLLFAMHGIQCLSLTPCVFFQYADRKLWLANSLAHK